MDKTSLKTKILNAIKNLISINSFEKEWGDKRVRIIEKNIPEINTNPIVSLDSKPAPEQSQVGSPQQCKIPVITTV